MPKRGLELETCTGQNASILTLFLFLLYAQEPVRDRKKVKDVKHDGNITLDDVVEIARIMKPRSMAKKLEVNSFLSLFSSPPGLFLRVCMCFWGAKTWKVSSQ